MAGTINTGSSSIDTWLATVWAPAADAYFRSEKKIASYCMDVSSRLTPGAVAVSFPQVANTAATSKTAGTAFTNYTNADEVACTVTLNQQFGWPFLVEDMAQVSTQEDLISIYSRQAGYALASALETYLAGIVQSATTNDVTLATDNTVLWTDVLIAYRKLKIAGVDIKQCAFGMSPEAFELSVASWGTKYTSAAEMGNQSFVASGAEGVLLGMPIYVSDDWDGDGGTGDETATIWHPNSVAYASHDVRVVGPVPDALNVGYALTPHIIFGATKAIDSGIVNFNNP